MRNKSNYGGWSKEAYDFLCSHVLDRAVNRGIKYFSTDKLADGQSEGGIAEFASEYAASRELLINY